jgi:hypothetical protein
VHLFFSSQPIRECRAKVLCSPSPAQGLQSSLLTVMSANRFIWLIL